MTRRRRFRRGLAARMAAGALLITAGCSSRSVVETAPMSAPVSAAAAGAASSSASPGSPPPESSSPSADGEPAALSLLRSAPWDVAAANGTDRIEVWVCDVPAATEFEAYLGLDFRLDVTPEDLIAAIEPGVAAYFDTLSAGRYVPTFEVGGRVLMEVDDTPTDCVDDALDQSNPNSAAVLAIANAEHQSTAAGGWGRPAVACPSSSAKGAPCPPSVSRRAAYVGASDFHPSWEGRSPLDLVQHEIGHTLGWPHSGSGPEGETLEYEGHDSGIDLMSNSAAPREDDPDRRDGPQTLAVNLFAAGWLGSDEIVVVDGQRGWSGPLASSSLSVAPPDSSTTRMVVVALDDHRMLSVELLNGPHFAPGIAVHLIDQSPAECDRPSGSGELCLGVARGHTAEVGQAPFTDLLGAGERWEGHGWIVTVRSIASDGASVEVAPKATDG